MPRYDLIPKVVSQTRTGQRGQEIRGVHDGAMSDPYPIIRPDALSFVVCGKRQTSSQPPFSCHTTAKMQPTVACSKLHYEK